MLLLKITVVVLILQNLFAMMTDAISRSIPKTQQEALTDTSKLLSDSIEIVVDTMNMRGHTDSWCKKNCNNPHLHPELNDVCNKFLEYTSLF